MQFLSSMMRNVGILSSVLFLSSFFFLHTRCFCADSSLSSPRPNQVPLNVSSNPSTINILPGTGDLGRALFQLSKDSPIRLGGVLLSDGDLTLTKNVLAGRLSGNNLLILGLNFDTEKCSTWKGGMFGVEFLQFNGMDSNRRVGSVQGFDSLSVLPPFNRSELYEIWFRQEFWNKKLAIRIGKMLPTLDFNNVLRPVPVQDSSLDIPSVSGLLYTPIFINPVNIGVMPGYYNSAYGVAANFAPTPYFYISAGAYDGNLARGVQTGLHGPHFNGYYFYALETGGAWMIGEQKKPGSVGVGGWFQTGTLSIPGGVSQTNAQGLYLFGSQRIWFCNPGVDHSGVSVFWQLGWNRAKTLPMNQYVGAGFTGYDLTRPGDSFGLGMALSKLNKRLFTRRSELMFQAYYQAYLFFNTFLEPVFTYIPTPGRGSDLPQTCIFSLQLINLF